ncbi:geranylgeranyl pyrophosphate synthase [Ignicoccus islandicus DSM 13165]|uniref:Geranylgeranyl pyrophosphate synthase n=1 Tax=Ignicoccus islandicus DSM 13165 TaxID=940295 RepID=A0A0U3F3G9_9CREN|nr:polyprenyl synthetase family protein [Ignicoccus islandicus]ALU12085.1 geranylgeranyl pyrophosphate synthase [Ignicoccus islandicus DSM 13165]
MQGSPDILYKAAQHLPKAGGKRLRPALVILVSKALGGTLENAIYPALSIELMHNFTLVHDDIMDRDEKRRGIPTVHVIYGEPMAILAGDLLYAKSYEALLKSRLAPDILKKMTEVLTWAAVTLAEGQALDMTFEERWDVSEEEYMEMINKKTGSLFAASAMLGGLAANRADLQEQLKELGSKMGVAFQIRDDLLSLIGDESKTGKSKYNDLREGKKTLIVIKALERASSTQLETLKNILGKKDASLDELERAFRILEETGALEYAQRKAEELAERAISIVKSLPVVDEDARNILIELIEFGIKREY